MGMRKNIKNTVKELKSNPRKVYFRLLNELIQKSTVYGVPKKELLSYLTKKCKELDEML